MFLSGQTLPGSRIWLKPCRFSRPLPRIFKRRFVREGEFATGSGKGRPRLATATVEVTVEYPNGHMPLRYRLCFAETGARFELRDEAVENQRPTNPRDEQPYFYYRYQDGRPVLNVQGEARFDRHLRREDVKPDQSILSQRRDPDSYPELTYVAHRFEQMRFYREFHVGRHTPPRLPQKADLQQNLLLEDASNLGLVLNDLLNRPP